MSGIAGIYNRDGRPADAALLRRMSDAMAHRGPDAAGQWTQGAVALGHRMLHSTPESLLEQQPLTDESGTLCLVLDGRVDNREELRAALEKSGALLRTDTDAELVLRAYERWGEQCAAQILGDFAFALWDGQRRQLYCARDILGIRPFYYWTDGGAYLLASELRALFEDPRVPAEPNEEMIAEHLTWTMTSREQTLYRGIFRLPPAHYMVIRQDGVRKVRYWRIDESKELRLASDDAYAEAFREVFREAVRCRMRACGPVGASLSGGLDSSSVVCMAQSLTAGRGVDAALQTYSLVFPGQSCDESRYIDAVVRKSNLFSQCAEPEPLSAATLFEQTREHRNFPFAPNEVMSDSLRRLARQNGVRVLLTGLGGDECLSGSYQRCADLIAGGHILRALGEARSLSRTYHAGPALQLLLRYGLLPLLPPAVRQGLRRLKRYGRASVADFLQPQFARRIGLTGRKSQSLAKNPPSFARRDLCAGLESGAMDYFYESSEANALRFGIELRHPFNDRRLIEFALSLPDTQRWRGEGKFVLRQAMRGLLPEEVRTRPDKAEFSGVFLQAFGALGGERFFERLAIEEAGWVRGEAVRGMYRQLQALAAQGSPAYKSLSFRLWMIAGAEIWLRTLLETGRASAARATAAEEPCPV